MTESRRILVIGLDGASFRLLGPLAASGQMPELAGLMAAGCHGELRSTFPPLTPPAWSSFMTGKNPGKHGVVSFRRAPAGYRTGDFINANTLRARTLWDIVGETGRTVGAVNVVPSYPVKPVNGFMVSCMLTPPGAKDIIYPPEYRTLLGDDYVISLEPPTQLLTTDATYRTQALDYIARLRQLRQRRLDSTLRLMRERPCDLLSIIFYEPDRIQHFFWSHLAGPGPAGVSREVVEEIAEAARIVYRELDAGIGELRRASGPDPVTFIISDHGFSACPERFVYVNRWLADRGWLHVHPSWRLRRRIVKQLPEKLRKRYDTVESIFVNWGKSVAWCDAMETRSAAVWLNVEGRQPEGCVKPGAEYERIREEIVRGLSDLEDGGRPVFKVVGRREDIYHGPLTDVAPDILLYANPSHGLRFNGIRPELRAKSPFDRFIDYGFTGAHEAAGVYVIAGPGVAALGRQDSKPIESIAPTVLAMFGIPIPDGMDAPPLLDFLTPEARAGTSVTYVPDVDPAPASEDDGYGSEEDRAQVEARLRALGYVE
jgi:predicted AlkP superfamily phosphohydrolase/phosphomutase